MNSCLCRVDPSVATSTSVLLNYFHVYYCAHCMQTDKSSTKHEAAITQGLYSRRLSLIFVERQQGNMFS